MSNGKVIIIPFMVELIKKTCIKMSFKQYFFLDHRIFGGNVSVRVDLFDYATKGELKNATGIDTSNFSLKSNLASLKAEVDKIDADKLKTVPDDLIKLSNVANNETVKKTV